MFSILDKDRKDLLPGRRMRWRGTCFSCVRWGKQQTTVVFSVLLPHCLRCFCTLLSTALHPPFFLFPQGQRKAQRHGECCEQCVSPAGSCSHDGIVRYQDEMWKGLACEFCICDRGQVTCHTGECAKVECAQVRSKGISTCAVTALSNGIGDSLPVLTSWLQRGLPG